MSDKLIPLSHFHKFDEGHSSTECDRILSLSTLSTMGIHIPVGFVLTYMAFTQFAEDNKLKKRIIDLISTIHYERPESVMQVSNHIKSMIIKSKFSGEFEQNLIKEFRSYGSFLKKPEVLINRSSKKIKDENILRSEIKKIWASQFDPKHLINAHHKKIDIFERNFPILITKVIDSAKQGRIHSNDLSIDTKSQLSQNEVGELKVIAKKLKNYWLIPQVVEWKTSKNHIYITDIKPQT